MRKTERGDVTAKPLIPIGEACEILGADRWTVDDWIRNGRLQAFTLPATAKTKGGKRYLVQSEVVDLARKRGRTVPGDVTATS